MLAIKQQQQTHGLKAALSEITGLDGTGGENNECMT